MGNFTINKFDKGTGEVTGAMNLEIRVYPITEPKGSTKGYASVTVDDTFGAHGISIIEGKNGLFVAMPQTKDSRGDFRDIFHPVTSEGRKALNDAVLSEYAAALDNLVTRQESTLAKIREGVKSAKEQSAQETPAVKEAGKGSRKKSDPEL